MGDNFSFDESEFVDTEVAADETLQSLEQTPVSSTSSEDESLLDVDSRLETADHYRAMLRHSFFDTETAAAKIVDREVRTFIRERLEVLLGIRSSKVAVSDPVVLPFDADEIQALKLLASKVLKKPSLVDGPSNSKPETFKSPAKPQVKPRPQVRTIPVPPPTPVTKPAPQAPKAQLEKKRKPPKPSPDAAKQVVPNARGDAKETLVEGAILEEGGRKYRVVMNDLGSLFKKDVTGQVVPPGVSKPMSPMEIEIQSRIQAEKQLAMVDQSTGFAILQSLKG